MIEGRYSRGWLLQSSISNQLLHRPPWHLAFLLLDVRQHFDIERLLFNPNLQWNSVSLAGIGANQNIKHAGLDDAVHVDIENGKQLRSEGKFHRRLLSWFQMNAAKAAQFHHRLRDVGESLMNVHLRHFVASPGSSVGHVHAHCGRAVLPDSGWIDPEILKMESGIAQSVAEWEERLAADAEVAPIGGRFVIVLVWNDAHRAGKSDG